MENNNKNNHDFLRKATLHIASNKINYDNIIIKKTNKGLLKNNSLFSLNKNSLELRKSKSDNIPLRKLTNITKRSNFSYRGNKRESPNDENFNKKTVIFTKEENVYFDAKELTEDFYLAKNESFQLKDFSDKNSNFLIKFNKINSKER